MRKELETKIEKALLLAFDEAEKEGKTIRNEGGIYSIIERMKKINPMLSNLDDYDLLRKITGITWGTSLFDVKLTNKRIDGRGSNVVYTLSEFGKYYLALSKRLNT